MSARAAGFAVVLSVLVSGMLTVPSVSARGVPTNFSVLERERQEAEIAKLDGEVTKLKSEQDFFGDLVRVAPFVTAIVALLGVFVTLWKQRADATRQRELDREERSKDRLLRFDSQFQQLAENLSAKEGAVRAAAAASIAAFMRPEYEDFHERLFLLLLGTLRFPQRDFGDKLLIRTFQDAAMERIPVMRDSDPDLQLDLSNCWLARVALPGVDLSNADLAFADLHGAELSGANLYRTRGFGVILNGARMSECYLQEARLVEAKLVKARLGNANLISAKLKGADAAGAVFRGARMQEAHLDGAILRGARFESANLDNAYFRGAVFDEAALRSIARGGLNWRHANWDAQTLARLTALSDEGRRIDFTRAAHPGRTDEGSPSQEPG